MGAVARERGGGDQRVLFRPAPARADSPPPCPLRDLVRRMRIPRDISGTHLADTLCRRWRYTKVHQVGSHIILETSEPAHQRIAIPGSLPPPARNAHLQSYAPSPSTRV